MNYYNEFDPKAAAWLKQLIQLNLIPQGDVDTRSITEVKPHELTGYTQCHFFAGIGGWSYALQLAEWPTDRPVWSMSCPCQPFSSAGKGLGAADERHLWPVAFNLIKECRPPVVFGEQVASSAVIGRRSEMDAMQQMRRKQTILRFLSGKESEATIILQSVQEQANQLQEEEELFSGQDHQEGSYLGWSGEVSRQKDGDTIRSGCRGNSLQDRGWSVRVDRDTIRPSNAESMEQPISRSDQAFSGLHQGQCEGSPVFCECDESQLGAEVCFKNCGCDARTAQEEVERLIGEVGGELEEEPTPWVDGVQDDLEKIDYTFGSCVMAASSVGAPHIRQRLYWMAYSDSGQCEKLWQCGDLQSEQPVQSASCDSAVSGLEYAECSRLLGSSDSNGESTETRRQTEPDNNREPSEGCADASGVADSISQQAIATDAGGLHTESCGSGIDSHWHNHTLIPCRDGKQRRIESGTFPLVNGLPKGMVYSSDPSEPINPQETAEARVMRLKGYGNAIVPQVAAAFIQAAIAASRN